MVHDDPDEVPSIIEPHDASAELTVGTIWQNKHAAFNPGRDGEDVSDVSVLGVHGVHPTVLVLSWR